MTRARQVLGAAGEDLSAAWYEERGYRVLARNWRCRQGELDLVLRFGSIEQDTVVGRATHRVWPPTRTAFL